MKVRLVKNEKISDTVTVENERGRYAITKPGFKKEHKYLIQVEDTYKVHSFLLYETKTYWKTIHTFDKEADAEKAFEWIKENKSILNNITTLKQIQI